MNFYSLRNSSRFYDSWEYQEESVRTRTIREALDRYVRFARESTVFYKDRLSAYDAQSDFPLTRVPVLNASELRNLVPPVSRELLSQTAGGDFTVFQSGGTTGVPKTTLFSHQELEGLNLPNARGFFAMGLKPEDRVANLFAVGGLYMTFVHINRMLQQYGCTNFPFSNHTAPDFIHTITRLLNVNCFTGIASVVIHALRGMEKLGLEGIRVEKVLFGGEHLYEADRRELTEKFGVQVIGAPGYGTVDTWYLGYQCLSCPSGVFHAHDDQAYIEVIDEETGKPCGYEEPGMLYATAFPRRLTPIVRYRVGDRVEWVRERCPCGRTTPLFRLLGRGDDVLRIGYDSVDYASVQKIVDTIPGLLGTLQLEKQRMEGRDKLLVRVESRESEIERQNLAHLLETALLEGRPSLREFVYKKTVWPVTVEVLAPNTLQTNSRTGKLVRVIDLRLE